MFNAANTNATVLIQQVQVHLLQIREAMKAAEALHDFADGLTVEDLTAPSPDGPGMNQQDAQALLEACADAWGHAELYRTGTDPRKPPAGYSYGTTQKRVIGPRPR